MKMLINIDVPNLKHALGFYCMSFGLTVKRRFGNAGVELTDGTMSLFLLEKKEGTPASAASAQKRNYARHWTPVHLDFVVDEIGAAVDKARGLGAVLEGEIETHAWGRIAHMADPFGHGFCLIEFLGRGYDEIAE